MTPERQMQRYVYMEDEGPSKDDRGLWVLYADAQRALDELKKEIAFRDFAQSRASDIALNYGTYDEIQKALSSEIALHAAWMKRATEAEAKLAALNDTEGKL